MPVTRLHHGIHLVPVSLDRRGHVVGNPVFSPAQNLHHDRLAVFFAAQQNVRRRDHHVSLPQRRPVLRHHLQERVDLCRFHSVSGHHRFRTIGCCTLPHRRRKHSQHCAEQNYSPHLFLDSHSLFSSPVLLDFSSISASAFPEGSFRNASHRSWLFIRATRCGSCTNCTPRPFSAAWTPSISATR